MNMSISSVAIARENQSLPISISSRPLLFFPDLKALWQTSAENGSDNLGSFIYFAGHHMYDLPGYWPRTPAPSPGGHRGFFQGPAGPLAFAPPWRIQRLLPRFSGQ